MAKIYIPSAGPSDWQRFLAKPEKQWRTGYSAKTLAHCWEAADGLPPEISAMFDAPAELLIALPEHKVALDGGGRESQNDVFGLIRAGDQTCAAAIEGKVNEPFGPTVGEWYIDASDGKRCRMRQLSELLGLPTNPPTPIRYQLLHRSASALIEAQRFKTDEAAMIVHSFSPERMWFEDFEAFLGLLGLKGGPDSPIVTTPRSGQRLRLGWATGDPKYLVA
jgi:hypothetical protein